MAGALGIDVASYQGNPNWDAVRKANVTFAYIKAGEGDSTGYKTLDSQYNGARRAGLPVGLYHYARPNLSPEANADSLAAQVNRLGAVAGHLPPCLDLEEGSGDLSRWAAAFVTRLRAKTGCPRVMLYSGASFFKSHIGESWMDPDVLLWIAHYGRPPGQPGYLTPRVVLHQFSSTGAVPGISGNVDLDHAVCPLAQLLTAESPTTEGSEMASVVLTLPAGKAQRQPIGVPPFQGQAQLYLSTGWTVAHIRAGYFIRDKGPGLTPQQEEWGGTGTFDLRPDDRPSWPLPDGCTQVSLEYDSETPLAVVITYNPA